MTVLDHLLGLFFSIELNEHKSLWFLSVFVILLVNVPHFSVVFEENFEIFVSGAVGIASHKDVSVEVSVQFSRVFSL